jgi:hypothetical protein
MVGQFSLRESDPELDCYIPRKGIIIKSISVDEPLVASWDAKSHPAHIKLTKHLEQIHDATGDLSVFSESLFLDYTIEVKEERRLTHQYDVENFLTPVAAKLGAKKFSLVNGRKVVGGRSRIAVGLVSDTQLCSFMHSIHLHRNFDSDSNKIALGSIVNTGFSESPMGAVQCRIHFQVGSNRNWLYLWEPAGDILGPILGQTLRQDRFDPCDYRIVDLSLSCDSETSLGNSIKIFYVWQTLPVPPENCDH